MKIILKKDFIRDIKNAEIIFQYLSSKVKRIEEPNDENVVFGYVWNTISISGFEICFESMFEYPENDITSIKELPREHTDPWTINKMDFDIHDENKSIDYEEIIELVEDQTDIKIFSELSKKIQPWGEKKP